MSTQSVLVVDDNRDMANGIAMLLEEQKLDVSVAYSGAEAIAQLEPREFDLVLTDIRMPSMSGIELLEEIRSRWPLTKVVLVTAYGSVDSTVGAMRGGAADYLTKPFDNDELIEVVHRVLKRSRGSGGFDLASVVGDVALAVSCGEIGPGLTNALTLLRRATGADDAEVFVCEPRTRTALLCAHSGGDGDLLVERVRFDPGEGYPGLITTDGTPIATRGTLASDPRFLRQRLVRAGIQSMAAAPLMDGDRPFGSIQLLSRRADFPVEHMIELLRLAAVPIANALRAELASYRQAVDSVRGDLDTEESVERLLDAMVRAMHATRGTIRLRSSGAAGSGSTVSTDGSALTCECAGGTEPCSWAVTGRAPLLGPNAARWPAPCRRALDGRAENPCCVPIISAEGVLGTVILDLGAESRAPDLGRALPVLAMADQLALRLEHPRAAAEHIAPALPASPAELEILCFGAFEIRWRGELVPLGAFSRRKALVLLQLLALRAGTPLHRDVLIEHLWPEVEPDRGANRLHAVLHDLRAVIERDRSEKEFRFVRNRGDLYFLEMTASVRVDLAEFRELSAQALRARPDEPRSVELLQSAAALYRGDLFEDQPFAEWCESERETLRDVHTRVAERLAQIHRKQSRPEPALDALRQASRTAPFRDDLVLGQLEILASLGRVNEAIATYEEYRRKIEKELDTQPSTALRQFRAKLPAN